MWVLYQEMILSGKAPEEIHGLLVWQVKSMLLASTSKNAIEAGLKPFVYTKSKGYAGHYSRDELVEMSARLVDIASQSRKGKDMGVMLEEFMLSL